MPLSKDKNKERMQQFRLHTKLNSTEAVQPNVQPLSHPVFGTIKSRYWAKQFFDSLGITQSYNFT